MINYNVIVLENGTRHWNNSQWQLHRLDGPAIECADGRKEWWVDGKLHRLDGPAIEYVSGTKVWCIEGVYYTEEEFQAKIQSMNRPCNGKKIVVDGVEYTLS